MHTMIWIGCRRECRVAVKYATRKHSGPHRSCPNISPRIEHGKVYAHTVSLTTVIVSMQRTTVSEVKYRESDSAYSFHSCPNRSWAEAIWSWLMIKYPSKKQ